MRDVQRVLEAAANDEAAARFLRHDPSALARTLALGETHVDAMRSADRFFTAEKPILDTASTGARRSRQPPQVVTGPFVAAATPPSAIVVSADTGTLLPGPTSATVTLTSSLTATAPPSPRVTPAPEGPPPDVPRPPAPPTAPQIAVAPYEPSPVEPPESRPVPVVPPLAPVPCHEHPARCCCGCCCAAAVVALVANVSATATTAITAISAMAHQSDPGKGSEE